ncbi:MAG: hypothetical protein U0821_02495 [Chloroflexota bacterium]
MHTTQLRTFVVTFCVAVVCSCPGTADAALATLAEPASLTGVVIGVHGSDRLTVETDQGVRLSVSYLGVRGPLPSSAWYRDSQQVHSAHLEGRRVVVETVTDPRNRTSRAHVNLEDNAEPASVALLRSGWLLTVPYDGSHRHDGRYLAAQAQALDENTGMWGSRGFGPVRPWAQPGNEAAGYVAAHPELHRVLTMLNATAVGNELIAALISTAPRLALRTLPESLGGTAQSLGFAATVNTTTMTPDGRAAAAVVAHELRHLGDLADESRGYAQRSCFETEIRAHQSMANAWRELTESRGVAMPRSDVERRLNSMLQFQGENDFVSYVLSSSSYQIQCISERPGLIWADLPGARTAATRRGATSIP